MNARPAVDLRRLIGDDLHPVRPLATPWVRTARLLPLALLLLVGAPAVLGLRTDLPQVGVMAGLGLSAAESVAGLLLVAAALREAVPGRALSARTLLGLVCAVAAGVLAITFTIFALSPTRVIHAEAVFHVWRICFLDSLASAVPAIVICGLLARRAFPLRPAVTGALYGLGSGLLADAGWRLYCHVSDPAHVLSAHAAALATAGLLGTGLAILLGRRRR